MQILSPIFRSLSLLVPALVPSWRFFDEVAPSPRIEFAWVADAQAMPHNWQEFRPRPAHLSAIRLLQRLFWNPGWNESLFLVSCSERLLADRSEHSAQEIRHRIAATLRHQPHGLPFFQFRVLLVQRQGETLHSELAYRSPVHPLGSVE